MGIDDFDDKMRQWILNEEMLYNDKYGINWRLEEEFNNRIKMEDEYNRIKKAAEGFDVVKRMEEEYSSIKEQLKVFGIEQNSTHNFYTEQQEYIDKVNDEQRKLIDMASGYANPSFPSADRFMDVVKTAESEMHDDFHKAIQDYSGVVCLETFQSIIDEAKSFIDLRNEYVHPGAFYNGIPYKHIDLIENNINKALSAVSDQFNTIAGLASFRLDKIPTYLDLATQIRQQLKEIKYEDVDSSDLTYVESSEGVDTFVEESIIPVFVKLFTEKADSLEIKLNKQNQLLEQLIKLAQNNTFKNQVLVGVVVGIILFILSQLHSCCINQLKSVPVNEIKPKVGIQQFVDNHDDNEIQKLIAKTDISLKPQKIGVKTTIGSYNYKNAVVTLFKPKNRQNIYYSFTHNGTRYRGSTGHTSEVEAMDFAINACKEIIGC